VCKVALGALFKKQLLHNGQQVDYMAAGFGSPPFFDSEATHMKNLLAISILGVGLAWAQHSVAAPANKHADKPVAPASCERPLDDFLHKLATASKHLAVSQSLTSAQYSFVQGEIKKHSKDHKVADGDGAIVIDSDGQFILLATLGSNVCTIVPLPADLVAAIIALGEPPASAATPPAPKSDPERPWL
jgi:hypothetical protein